MEKKGFKVLFCERFNCPPDDYENRAFRRCLYWHSPFIAPVLRLLSSKFSAEDFKLMPELGLAIDWREANTEILAFQDTNRERKSFLANCFKNPHFWAKSG